jgi:hypothetical protein
VVDTRIAVAPGPIEPLEGRVLVVAQRVDFRDLVGGATGILLDLRGSPTPVRSMLPRAATRQPNRTSRLTQTLPEVLTPEARRCERMLSGKLQSQSDRPLLATCCRSRFYFRC